MRPMAELQKKRERKAARRRFVNKKRRRYLSTFGAFVGEQMYRAWRKRECR